MKLFLHDSSRKGTLYSTPLQSSCLSQLRTGPSWATWSSGDAICEDSGSAVWKESGIMMWDSRKEPWAVPGFGRREGGCEVEDLRGELDVPACCRRRGEVQDHLHMHRFSARHRRRACRFSHHFDSFLWRSSSLCVCMLNRCFRRYSQVFSTLRWWLHAFVEE